ncbi:hypothetical protein B9Z55_027539 [Caenorhabditis nigoni]|uniref:Uncharacterized protein n=1 Tax=Caenorhabditis nigoni TaxID=1611254 RepID=A0A2G5SFK8_9PELO|nr:hypothetical protein B9Z55_027539 [Caenorhabditis nigoni]
MDKPINSGPDGSRVQTPDDRHHDAENMYSRIRKRRSNEICKSYLNDDEHHEADNMYKRVYKRRSRETAESSSTNGNYFYNNFKNTKTQNCLFSPDITRKINSNEQTTFFSGTTSMSNVQTANNAIYQLKATNSTKDQTVSETTNQSNANHSTEDRLAIKKTIMDLGNKYGETIALHKKSSAEVKRAKRCHMEKLKELVFKTRVCQNPSNSVSYSLRIHETSQIIRANEEDIKNALEAEESTKDDMEEAEAEWKFEAMCSGEAYYENGEWKWRD